VGRKWGFVGIERDGMGIALHPGRERKEIKEMEKGGVN